jgi:hypothetical protein
MNSHVIEPEVIVGLGDNTEMDQTQHPPLVTELHIELEDWLGDDLLETFPCYLATDALTAGLQKEGFSGFEVADVELTLGEYFENNYHLAKPIPTFKWLKIKGKIESDDFSLTDKTKLCISERAWWYIKNNFAVQYARIDASNDLDDLFEGVL